MSDDRNGGGVRFGLSRLIEHPKVYDIGQTLAGVHQVNRQLDDLMKAIPRVQSRIVLDAGGGTAISRGFTTSEDFYVCADNDPVKLTGARRKEGSGLRLLQTDATNSGLRGDSVDLVLCKAVSHHIPDESLGELFEDSRRILKPSGWFVFLDPVWVPGRLPSRLLWSIDRGSWPRTPERLLGVAEQSFEVVRSVSFRVIHEYLALIAHPLG